MTTVIDLLNSRYFVVAYGLDCDGYNNGHLYDFESEADAEQFAHTCNEGSDGLQYQAVDFNTAQQYAVDYNRENQFKDMTRMIQIARNSSLDQTTFTHALIWLIVKGGTPIDQISLNEQSVYDAWASGYSPWALYYDIWEQDAGNYWAI